MNQTTQMESCENEESVYRKKMQLIREESYQAIDSITARSKKMLEENPWLDPEHSEPSSSSLIPSFTNPSRHTNLLGAGTADNPERRADEEGQEKRGAPIPSSPPPRAATVDVMTPPLPPNKETTACPDAGPSKQSGAHTYRTRASVKPSKKSIGRRLPISNEGKSKHNMKNKKAQCVSRGRTATRTYRTRASVKSERKTVPETEEDSSMLHRRIRTRSQVQAAGGKANIEPIIRRSLRRVKTSRPAAATTTTAQTKKKLISARQKAHRAVLPQSSRDDTRSKGKGDKVKSAARGAPSKKFKAPPTPHAVDRHSKLRCVCNKTFKTEKIRDAHVRQRTRYHHFRCDRCPATYYGFYSLKKHYAMIHENVTEYGHYQTGCSICGQKFKTDPEIRLHKMHCKDED